MHHFTSKSFQGSPCSGKTAKSGNRYGYKEKIKEWSKSFEELREFVLFWLPHFVARVGSFSDLY